MQHILPVRPVPIAIGKSVLKGQRGLRAIALDAPEQPVGGVNRRFGALVSLHALLSLVGRKPSGAQTPDPACRVLTT